MTEYTNLDLETAKAKALAAGQPELADAFYHQAQGVRNLVQGEWGQSFVGSFEEMLKRYITPLHEEVSALRLEVGAIQGQFQGVNERLDASEADRRAIHEEIAALEKKLDSYIAGSKREELIAIRRELDALKQARGDGDG